MALASAIRAGISTANKVTASLQSPYDHVTWTGQDESGDPTTVTVKRKAILEQKLRAHRLPDGRVVEVKATLTILEDVPFNGAPGRTEPFDPRDEFVLPDGTRGMALDIDGVYDPESGKLLAPTLYLGRK